MANSVDVQGVQTYVHEEYDVRRSIEQVEYFLDLSNEERVRKGTPLEAAGKLWENLKAKRYGQADHSNMGKTILCFYQDLDGSISCVILGANDAFFRIVSLPQDLMLNQALVMATGYELENDCASIINDILSAENPKCLYNNVLRKNSVLKRPFLDQNQATTVDVNLKLICRYLRSGGGTVAMVAGLHVDLGRLQKKANIHLDHYMQILLSRQGTLFKQGNLDELMALFQDASEILIASLDENQYTANNHKQLTALHQNPHKHACEFKKLVQHQAYQFNQCDHVYLLFLFEKNQVHHQHAYHVIPYPIVRARFIVPILDLAATHGADDENVHIYIINQRLHISCFVYIESGHYPGTSIAQRYYGHTFADRVQAIDAILAKIGLGCEWQHEPESNNSQKALHIIATLTGAHARVTPASIENTKVQDNADCNFALQQDSHNHIVHDLSERRDCVVPVWASLSEHHQSSSTMSTTLYTEASAHLTRQAYEGELDLFPSFPPDMPHPEADIQTRLYILDHNPQIAQIIKSSAERYCRFESIVAISEPDDLFGLEYMLTAAIETTHRIVLIIDECLYTLDDTMKYRQPITGTQLRDNLLNLPIFQNALQDHRLFFIGYATSQLQDKRLHLTQQKIECIPPKLLYELLTLLAKSPLPLSSPSLKEV